ncbi:porin, partial [Caballeronia sp. M23-90]
MKIASVVCAAGVASAVALSAPSSVHAQSSVTLYGSLDAGLGYVSNLHGSRAFIAEQGTLQADRFGFQGVEDLGGGRSALFRLEGGFV